MKLNKIVLSIIAALLCFAAVYADDIEAGSIKEPGKNKVVLIGRVSFKTPIDIEARRATMGGDIKAIRIGNKEKKNLYTIKDAGLLQAWELEEPFYYTEKVEKDGTVTIRYSRCTLFGNPYVYFDLPMGVKVAIPEEAKYVYVGNFEYDLDYALRIVGFNHIDEFDLAQKQINRATGKDVELVRGELTFLSEEELEKE